MLFSQRLRELREQKKVSMMSLAQSIGVSDAAVCKWENGISEPKANNIQGLAEYFEVSSDYLLGLENDVGNKKYSTPNFLLSAEEIQLVKDYRELTPALKEMLHGILSSWKPAQANGESAQRGNRHA